jgi:hypothetical protein
VKSAQMRRRHGLTRSREPLSFWCEYPSNCTQHIQRVRREIISYHEVSAPRRTNVDKLLDIISSVTGVLQGSESSVEGLSNLAISADADAVLSTSQSMPMLSQPNASMASHTVESSEVHKKMQCSRNAVVHLAVGFSFLM